MSISNYTKQVHTEFDKQQVLYAFNGEVNGVNIVAFLKIIEGYLLNENSHQIKRKLSQILVEILQNINKHGLNTYNNHILNSTLVVAHNASGFYISTCSNIKNEDIESLKAKIEKVNGLSAEDLNAFYKTSLQTNTLSDKGGAGLGIIEMVKKSGNKIDYSFEKVNEDYSVFSLNVNVNSK